MGEVRRNRALVDRDRNALVTKLNLAVPATRRPARQRQRDNGGYSRPDRQPRGPVKQPPS
jgi:hypothetical protein